MEEAAVTAMTSLTSHPEGQVLSGSRTCLTY